MSLVNELQEQQDKLAMSKISGKTKNIQINERTLEAYKEEYAKKGLTQQGKMITQWRTLR